MIKKILHKFGYVPISEIQHSSLASIRWYLMSYELTPDEGESLIKFILTRCRKPGRISKFMTDISSLNPKQSEAR